MQLARFAALGSFGLSVKARPISHFPTEKVRALFVYLALEPKLHRREALAELLWPDNPPGMALKNLRLSLYRLRQVLEDAAAGLADQLLIVSRQTLGLNHSALEVDALQFQSIMDACERHRHSTLAECEHCLAQLQSVIAEYRGELLPDLSLADAPAFDEWLILRREALHNLAQQSLQALTVNSIRLGDYEQALATASQALALDAYCEENHRLLMTVLAYLGQTQRALAQYRQCCRILEQEFNLEPSAETVALMQQIRAGSLKPASARPSPVVRAPEAPSAPAHHNNLPAQLTAFVGRQHELSELRTLLGQPGTRLITVSGTGGMGKTRLALELAQHMLAHFRNGVTFVSLAALSDPLLLASTIATALALDPQSDPNQQLCDYLRDKQQLLVLDNAEHLLDSVSEISLALLEAAPHLKILVTSRELLNIRGEYRYVVPALVGGFEESLETASQAPSVMLFVQSAQRSLAGFQMNRHNMADVLRICQLVQGMPLGLELAAAWVANYSLSEIADAIAQNSDFLAYSWRGVAARQRSIRAIFDWSWKLLNQQEQRVLRHVALFRGGFSPEAARVVAGASQAILIHLTQASLLYQHETSFGWRYSMHQLLHQFAIEHYASAAEHEAVEARHSSYYLHFLSSRERRLNGGEPRATAAEIQTEIDNIRQAWIWAITNSALADLDQAASALYQYYAITGQLADRIQMFELACRSLEMHTKVDIQETSQHKRTLGKLLALYSIALARDLQNELAISTAQRAIALSQWSLEGAALGFMAWGYAMNNQGLALPAREHLEHALELIEECQQRQELSEMLIVIGWATHLWLALMNTRISDFQRARAHALQAWQLCQTEGLSFGKVDSLNTLGMIALIESDLAEAQRYYEQAYELISTISSRTGEWDLLVDLAEVIRLQGNYARAHALIKHALVVAHELANGTAIHFTQLWLLRLLCLMGDSRHATELFLQLKQLDIDSLAASQRMLALIALAMYAQLSADHQQVLAHTEACWSIAQSYGHSYDQAYCLVQRGHALAMLRHADARIAYEQALAIYETLAKPGLAAEAWAGLAMLALERGELMEAMRITEHMLQIIVSGVRIGLDEPFFVYLACYRILSAAGDLRASGLLQAAQTLVYSYSEQIDDEYLRKCFLNREIIRQLMHSQTAYQLEAKESVLSR